MVKHKGHAFTLVSIFNLITRKMIDQIQYITNTQTLSALNYQGQCCPLRLGSSDFPK